jgi:hypothetical protein
MAISRFLDWMPLEGLYVLCVLLVIGFIGCGYLVGKWRRGTDAKLPEGAVGSVIAAMLGLLAFFLAITFGIAAGRFDSRRQLLLDEVNAIGTAMLRADMMPDPHRGEVRRLIKSYVDIRADIPQDAKALAERIAASERIQTEIWAQATAIAAAQPNSQIVALFVASLNEMFDLHTSRTTHALQYRIPGIIWIGLIVVTFFSMAAVGMLFGVAGRCDWLILVALALTYSAVVLLIADLDSPGHGMLRVSQRPMQELRAKLNSMP